MADDLGVDPRERGNVIDFARLALHPPELARDLPGGGHRLVQRAEGYVATIVNGRTVYRDGQHSGELPGRLVRGKRTCHDFVPLDETAIRDRTRPL